MPARPGRAASSNAAAAGAGGFSLLYLGAFLVYADRFAIPPMLLAISQDLDEPLGAVTAVATVYFLLYGLMQFPYGVASDRFGRVRVMRFALFGLAATNLGAAFAPTLPLLAAAKALAAGAAAAVLPTALVYVGDRVPFERRQQVIVNVLAAGALGTALATVAAGLAARFEAWRVVFAVSALLALLVGLALGRLPEMLVRSGGEVVRQLRSVLSRPWAAAVIVLAVAEGAVMVGLLTYLPPALEASGHSAAVAGLVVASYGVVVFLGTRLVKQLLRRTPPQPAWMIAIGGGLLSTAWTVAAVDQGVVAILAASALVGLGYAFAHSTLQTWATEVAPQARGTATSLFVTGVFTGAALATAGLSGLAGAGRYGVLFGIAAVVTVPVLATAALGRARFGAA